jgi:acetyl esterase/lipase
MPSLRARWTRFFLRHYFGRKYGKAGLSVRALRKLDESLARLQRPPKGSAFTPVSLDGLPVEWIEGPGASSKGVVLLLHGGAFVTGSPATHRELAARISAAAGMRVLSLDYRLAPEHPFPAAVEDAVKGYDWLLNQGHSPAELVIGGESSGGGLALQTLLALKDRGVPMPSAAVFLSPVTDWVAFDGESYTTRAKLDPLLTLQQCQFTAGLYAGDSPAPKTLLQPTDMDLSRLPPMWIQVGDHEVLLSDAERLAERAAEAGVAVDFKVWPGLWHVFQAAAGFVPEGKESIEELGRFLRKHISNAAEIDPETRA